MAVREGSVLEVRKVRGAGVSCKELTATAAMAVAGLGGAVSASMMGEELTEFFEKTKFRKSDGGWGGGREEGKKMDVDDITGFLFDLQKGMMACLVQRLVPVCAVMTMQRFRPFLIDFYSAQQTRDLARPSHNFIYFFAPGE